MSKTTNFTNFTNSFWNNGLNELYGFIQCTMHRSAQRDACQSKNVQLFFTTNYTNYTNLEKKHVIMSLCLKNMSLCPGLRIIRHREALLQSEATKRITRI